MFFLFEGYGDHRALHVLTHSFPTRRSSDLPLRFASVRIYRDGQLHSSTRTSFDGKATTALPAGRFEVRLFPDGRAGEDRALRSEEHTSELQSLMRISYAVFCLKKKTRLKEKTQTDSLQETTQALPST